MKRLFTLGLTLALIFSTLLIGKLPVANAAGICNGLYAIRIYYSINYEAADGTVLWCSNASGDLFRSNLSNYTAGLCCGSNWNDAISSFKIYNAGSNKQTRFYQDSGYGSPYFTVLGSVQLSQMPTGWNDRVTSFKNLN